ncbi:Ltp family lipoprotein [Novosphingopyxis sp. YJ-S2-01]|uniref:Ltp family lipoprotein n=1 Tax=Novosphingopyxis sp. YJ-S2-01 TaxID=2794021 RepID=UPI0018DDEC75|nr:Ltp family lipoprotein [Novosphingopyxis sp. YJ-S2-01]MBH9537916.1 Ltp family lipoprotein [Novosphingopyxis sp. YJ-S2-01]
MANGTKLCRECGTANPRDAEVCSNCGATFASGTVAEPKKSGSKAKKLGLGCLSIFVLLFVIGLFASPDPDEATADLANIEAETMAAPAASTDNNEDIAEPAATIEPAEPSLTGPQRNAVRSANSYLALTGFSRAGLINQLSSDAGEGYDEADATVAVDSLNVDWNEQAVRSAKQYLDLTGFSCSGLIEQLSSSAGEKYTNSEARYGAEQAGAC